MVLSSNPCDPSPSWFPQRSRYNPHKRSVPPYATVPQSMRVKRLRTMPAIEDGLPFIAPREEKPSDEQSGRRGSTQDWFDEINRDVPMMVDPDLIESKSSSAHLCSHTKAFQGEPPFYLKSHAPSRTVTINSFQSDISVLEPHSYRDDTSILPPSMQGHGTCGCSEEYRSVIDDLTVENKQLRQKLKTFEQLHCSHLQKEKLFEVKIHGLPVHKRRDLEQALREIAASLDEPTAVEGPKRCCEYSSRQAPQTCKTPIADGIPDAIPIDSAYASTAASEKTHNVRPIMNDVPIRTQTASLQTRQQNVSTYLRDIPSCLMPSQSADISYLDKRRMVVRRLEQLFIGKSAASDQPDSPRQQQEVSQSAPMGEGRAADDSKVDSCPEGAREAKILATEMECGLENAADKYSDLLDGNNDQLTPGAHSHSGNPPRQRATRPMDLDMHQAQYGADNMSYIRHLGLCLPLQQPGLPNAGDGWVYLNLLMSMAQIHTLNVTPDFVRKAVAEMSSKIELSSDGQQVRWRGDVNESSVTVDREEARMDEACVARSVDSSTPLEKPTSSRSTPEKRSDGRVPTMSQSDHPYKALSRCEGLNIHSLCGQSDIGLSYVGTADGVQFSDDPHTAQSFGNAIPPLQTKEESGPIIFYSNATFCTDLSGTATHELPNDINYSRCIERPLGSITDYIEYSGSEGPSERRDLSRSARAASDSDSNTPLETDLCFPDVKALSLNFSSSKHKPVAFEASGLSGIQPEDNFMVVVRVQHALDYVAGEIPAKETRLEHTAIIPRLCFIANSSVPPNICGRIISCITTILAPSSLPPPSYICLPFSSSESGSSDSDADSDDDDAYSPFPGDDVNH